MLFLNTFILNSRIEKDRHQRGFHCFRYIHIPVKTLFKRSVSDLNWLSLKFTAERLFFEHLKLNN